MRMATSPHQPAVRLQQHDDQQDSFVIVVGLTQEWERDDEARKTLLDPPAPPGLIFEENLFVEMLKIT